MTEFKYTFNAKPLTQVMKDFILFWFAYEYVSHDI